MNHLEDYIGKTYFTKKIFIKNEEDEINLKKTDRKKSYIYIGQINNYGEKHGKGILYYLDGSSMEEGNWHNDYLIGWCRIMLPNGVYFECK